MRSALDRRPVAFGAVVTAVAAGGSYLLARALPLPLLRQTVFDLAGVWIRGNPIGNLYVASGFAGGAVAGYFTDDRRVVAVTNASKAVLLGVLVPFLAFVGYGVAQQLAGTGPFTVPAVGIVAFVGVVLPLGAVFLLEGILASYVANWFRRTG